MNVYSIVTNDRNARLLKSFCVVNNIPFTSAGIGCDVYVSFQCTENDSARIDKFINSAFDDIDSENANYIFQFADWFRECCIPDYIIETGLTMKDIMNDFANIVALSLRQYNDIWDAIEMLII